MAEIADSSQNLRDPKDEDSAGFHNCTLNLEIDEFSAKKHETDFISVSQKFSNLRLEDDPESYWILKVLPLRKRFPSRKTGGFKKDFVSLFVRLESQEDIKIHASCTVSIVDEHGQEVPGRQFHGAFTMTITENQGGSEWGWMNFISHEELLNSDLLQKDCLRVRANIRFVDISDSSAADAICGCLREMYESGDESDIVLVSSEGREFPAHKFPLCLQSNVLKCDLRKIKTKPNEVFKHKMEDLDGETLSAMLKFCYGFSNFMPESVEKLLLAAKKYRILQLEWQCIRRLQEGLTVERAASLLKLADLYSVSNLKNRVLQFIGENFKEFVAAGGYEAIGWSNLDLLREISGEISQPAGKKFKILS